MQMSGLGFYSIRVGLILFEIDSIQFGKNIVMSVRGTDYEC